MPPFNNEQANNQGKQNSQQGKRHIVFVTDSFSLESGGRTASMFHRAKLFGEMGHPVHIAALNLRPGYQKTFDKLCQKYGVENTDFLNPYQFYCGSNLFEEPPLLYRVASSLRAFMQNAPQFDTVNTMQNNARKMISPSGKSASTAVILSCLVVGLGQIYLGQTLKGIVLLLIAFMIGILISPLLLFIPSIIIYIGVMIDAYKIGEKLEAGQSVGEWEFF